jgi:hypothetical protein
MLHRRIGEALEVLYREQIDDVAGQIALHFTKGGWRERAAGYALRAAERAASVAAWSEAAEFYHQALMGVPVNQRLPFAHFSDGWLPDAIRDLTNNDPAARTLPFYSIRKPCMKTSEPRVNVQPF